MQYESQKHENKIPGQSLQFSLPRPIRMLLILMPRVRRRAIPAAGRHILLEIQPLGRKRGDKHTPVFHGVHIQMLGIVIHGVPHGREGHPGARGGVDNV